MSGSDATMSTENVFSNDLAYPKDDYENELTYLNNTTSYGNESVDYDMGIFGGKTFEPKNLLLTWNEVNTEINKEIESGTDV